NSDNSLRVVEVRDPQSGKVRYADLLVELDDSGLMEQFKGKGIDVDKAKNLTTKALEDLAIARIDAATAIGTARNAVEIARLDLIKYIGQRAGKMVDQLLPRTDQEVGEKLAKLDMSKTLATLENIVDQETGDNENFGEYRQSYKEIEGRLRQKESDLEQQ